MSTPAEENSDSADTFGDPDAPLVELDGVTVDYEQGGMFARMLTDERVRAVDDISLEIEETDVVALIGESGCGKTTLGKTAIGLQEPTEGSVSYRGHDIWDVKRGNDDSDLEWDDIRRALQIVHQDPSSALNSHRSVRAILSEPLKNWRGELSANDREEQIYRLLDRVGMKPAQDYANRYPHQLSGGEQQRVVLCRALLMNPDLILADEAVSALDVSLRIEMMDLMLELRESFETSLLFISHDLANARYLTENADGRIGVMYMGEVVEIGTPEEILYNPKHPYTKVMIWSTPILDPEQAREALEEKPPVRSIDIPDATDPPSGCKFHTRCAQAREACTRVNPELTSTDDGGEVACFLEQPYHEYWDTDYLDPTAAEERTLDWEE